MVSRLLILKEQSLSYNQLLVQLLGFICCFTGINLYPHLKCEYNGSANFTRMQIKCGWVVMFKSCIKTS